MTTQIQPTNDTRPPAHEFTCITIDEAQVNAFISFLSSANPAITIPKGKAWADVMCVSVSKLPDGKGTLNTVF